MSARSRRGFLRMLPSAVWFAGAGSALILEGGCSSTAPEQTAVPPPDPARTAWFRDARFGLFLHWGPYSAGGVEASWPIMAPHWLPDERRKISEEEYTALPERFNPMQYEPQDWVRQAKQAGMRYIVITTKHHDGFCMFDAPGTGYKITNTPYGKDVLAMLVAACREEQMPLGFYYSPPDMHHPGYRDTSKPATENWNGEPSRPEWASYLDYMESHLRALLTNYGDVAVIWFDGLFEQDKYDSPRFHRLIHELQPRTLINDRLGPGGDFVTPEQFFPEGIPIRRHGPPPEVTAATVDGFMKMAKLLPREKVAELIKAFARDMYPTAPCPGPDEFQLWETCMTMNDTWGYDPSDKNFKPLKELIRTLVEVASRGGNFLLNVGPTGLGTFPPESEQRLRQIGEWMEVNGESIYGTTYTPWQDIFGRSTRKPGVIYLQVFDWPEGELQLSKFPDRVTEVSLLAGGLSCPFNQSKNRLTIEVPARAPDPVASVLAIRTAV